MIRVVSGQLRGRRLQVPPVGSRPTSERVRAAIFDALASRGGVIDTRVLDLYAGSGALAIEALSRGAASAVLVESAQVALKTLRANLAGLGLTGRAEVLGTRVQFLLMAPPREGPFDVVFADPPYAIDVPEMESVIALLATGGWLAEDGVLVLERSSRTLPTRLPKGLSLIKAYEYGDTRVELVSAT